MRTPPARRSPKHDNDDIVALLESGKDVITTTSYNHLPTYGAEVTRAIEAACSAAAPAFSTRPVSTPGSCSKDGHATRAITARGQDHGAGASRMTRCCRPRR